MTLRGRSHQKRRPPPLAGLQVRVVWQTVRPGSVCHRLAAGFGTCSKFMGSVACGATCLPLQLPELKSITAAVTMDLCIHDTVSQGLIHYILGLTGDRHYGAK